MSNTEAHCWSEYSGMIVGYNWILMSHMSSGLGSNLKVRLPIGYIYFSCYNRHIHRHCLGLATV